MTDQSPKGSANVAVNFLPVRFRARTFTAGVLALVSAEQLDSPGRTRVVRSDGNRDMRVPLAADAADVGTSMRFRIGGHRHLTMRLVQEALIGEVVAMKCKLCASARPVFVSRDPQHDLFALSAGD